MKSTSKKGSQKSSRKRQSRPAQKKPAANKLAQLVHKVETLQRELTEGQLRENATSEILGVIASSPTDLQPVLDAVAENAAKLCNAIDAQIFRVEQDVFRRVASYGPISAPVEELPLVRTIVTGRAILERQTIQVQAGNPEIETEFPDSKPFFDRFGFRTLLVTPLLREGVSLGAVVIRRMEAIPFTDKQITLLKTFASQAVIAIENVRLFQELQARTSSESGQRRVVGTYRHATDRLAVKWPRYSGSAVNSSRPGGAGETY